jgi:hypothetical protein
MAGAISAPAALRRKIGVRFSPVFGDLNKVSRRRHKLLAHRVDR